MLIDLNDAKLQTLEQPRAFLSGMLAVEVSPAAEERDAFVAHTVRRFDASHLKRPDKKILLRVVKRISGYSRQQLTRLVRRVGVTAPLVKRHRGSRTGFARTSKRCTAPFQGLRPGSSCSAPGVFLTTRPGNQLATVSMAHLYNLRKRAACIRNCKAWTRTRPVKLTIGERHALASNNQSGRKCREPGKQMRQPHLQ